MEFRIADTFTDSLARLTGEEQKAVKTTAFDLQINPVNPGLSFHKLAKAKDKHFWSVRVSSDLRLIVHRAADSLLLCYVDHHDKAYAWAERRKLETHPATGAAQLVEIRERVQEILVPSYVEPARTPAPKNLLFARLRDEELLGYGVPAEWLTDVRQATEDTVLALADHLPAEAAEALLELATGGTPRRPTPAPEAVDPFDHPDARRRFRVVTDVEELARALEYPWERWTVFLHPAQRELVERHFAGPARIAGSAGTGKTVVALHRAAHLARTHPDARILLTTFSETLASALRTKLGRLIGTEPRLRERIDVDALETVARRLYDRLLGRTDIASQEMIRTLMREVDRRRPSVGIPRRSAGMRTLGFTVLAGAAVASLAFVRVLEPTTLAMTAFLSGWLLLPYIVLALILALSAKRRAPAIASVLVSVLVAAGGVLFLIAVIYVYPDPQGGIAVLFTPIYQGLAIAVLLPVARWLVKKVSRPA